MKYINARKILPSEMLMKLQDYAEGQMLYIPFKDTRRAGWGEANGTKARYIRRNEEIITAYQSDMTVTELSCKYFLSPESIRKIISSGGKK